MPTNPKLCGCKLPI